MIATEGLRTLRAVATSSPPLGAGAPPREVRPDVVLDLPRSRHMSAGMTAYAEAIASLVPVLAPDLYVDTIVRTSTASFSEQATLAGALAKLDGRLVHHLSPYAPLFGPVPFVITIHDLIHLRYPQYFKKSVPLYYQQVVRRVCAAAARVIVDDERTVGDLALYLDVDPANVSVVPLGVDERFRADGIVPYEHRAAHAPGRPRPYLLYVGNHKQHKDLPTLFSAWASLPESFELDLLVTGPDDFAATPLPWRAGSALHVLGDVDAAALPALYAGAAALVHPSLCEGFGLPLVEAASVGTRVIACAEAVPSALAPLVETFEARDFRALAEILRHPTDPARLAAARDVARSLTWERCALATAEIYRSVLARPPA